MFGVSSMTAPLRRVAVRRPGSSMLGADPASWHYGPNFDPQKVLDDHSNFVELLIRGGAEVIWMENNDRGIADAVFTYDASLMTPQGAVLLSPGKPLRAGEQEIHREFYGTHDIPIIGEITGNARIEAGDTLWLDDSLLAVGRGFRTNQDGIDQLTDILAGVGIRVQSFDLPHYHGKDACLHLMSLVSLVETRVALVCMELVPVAMLDSMQSLGYALLKAPFDEFQTTQTLSTNILATSPGHCIMIAGAPKTENVLRDNGISVDCFEGKALCIGCEGGPICMTRPILRCNEPIVS